MGMWPSFPSTPMMASWRGYSLVPSSSSSSSHSSSPSSSSSSSPTPSHSETFGTDPMSDAIPAHSHHPHGHAPRRMSHESASSSSSSSFTAGPSTPDNELEKGLLDDSSPFRPSVRDRDRERDRARGRWTLRRRRPVLFSVGVLGGCLLVLVVGYLGFAWFLPDKEAIWPSLSHGDQTTIDVDPSNAVETGNSASTSASANASANATLDSPPQPSATPSQQDEVILDFAGEDSTHVRVKSDPDRPPIELLTKLHRIPYPVLEQYFATGTFPASLPDPKSMRLEPIDLVYLFVNGSSTLFQNEFDHRVDVEDIHALKGRARRWRENGELRGAIRSGVSSLDTDLGTVHILSADFPAMCAEDDSDGLEQCRVGQVPFWLDYEKSGAAEGTDGLRWHFHSEVFRLPRDQGQLHPGIVATGWFSTGWKDEEAWQKEALPSFNSFEIETHIGWLGGLADNFVLSNDDMFFLSHVDRADFHHPLLGAVVRLDPGLRVKPIVTPDLKSTPGEWGGLQYANKLLSGRFTPRNRNYLHHMPKALSKAVVHEVSVMFAPEMAVANTRGLRESKRGEADIEMAWLVTHMRMERWREALLWVWAVAKLGGVEGVWGSEAKVEIRRILRLADDAEIPEQVQVQSEPRRTLDDLGVIEETAGWPGAEKTTYAASSFDGRLPDDPMSPREKQSCWIQIDQCLPPNFFDESSAYRAQDVFVDLAFRKPNCGDCFIDALVRDSGARGLSAFLPADDAVFYPVSERTRDMWEREEPILPLVSKWEEGDFSIEANVKPGQDAWPGVTPTIEEQESGSVNLRRWAIKLLSRYTYVFGNTASRFSQIHSLLQLKASLAGFDKDPGLALACLNDDQPDRTIGSVKGTLGQWMEGRWGGKGPWDKWERPGAKWGE